MLKTEDILHSLRQLKLPPDLVNVAIEYAMLSALPEMTEQSSDRVADILELATQYQGFDLILNEIDRWCIEAADINVSKADYVTALDGNEIPLIDLLRRYALLSSQPVLSENAAHQISIILELAEANEVLALLLNEVDRLLLESTGLLSEEAQHLYANETSRILEFSPTIPETDRSEELLHLLSDQCATANQYGVLSKEDHSALSLSSFGSAVLKPPESIVALPLKCQSPLRLANKATRASFEFISRRYKASFLIAAFTTITALMTGITIAGKGCFSAIQRSPGSQQQIKTATAPTQSDSDKILVALLLKAVTERSLAHDGLSSGVVLLASSGARTAILDRQQFEERQQSVIEQAQSQIEQRQAEAEEKQIAAERQHRYQEAQGWHQEAQRNLMLSRKLRKEAQTELTKVQDLALESRSTNDAKQIDSRDLPSALQSRRGSPLLSCSLPVAFLMERALFIVLLVLVILSFTAMWKREFN
ncbi:MAG: hypothetical protein KME10_08610 [Plectolyngbya sp. WJT66-NPBG17]|jgi:hypothetical protein|nr:hypothetical protein [Plectolyngbya sp. WJT66-NPBG17]MBW4524222.1 hypothetical protein [Phormidium tanganyikae FI6-MK23]